MQEKTSIAFFVAGLLCLCAFFMVACGSKRFAEGPVDLEKWTAVNFTHAGGQGHAKWVLSEDKQSVTQRNNADPSLLVSERVLGKISIAGTWLVDTNADDDLIGFVFAYQNPGQFYVFDWKGVAQDSALLGMSLKIVNVPYDGPESGNLPANKPLKGQLWPTKDATGTVELLDHSETEGWRHKKPYRFQLDFRPGEFSINVKDEERVIHDKTYRDDTFRDGKFGFYNNSQGMVVYRGFETAKLPMRFGMLWWILPLLIVLLLVAAYIVVTRRRRATTAEAGS